MILKSSCASVSSALLSLEERFLGREPPSQITQQTPRICVAIHTLRCFLCSWWLGHLDSD